MRVLLDPQVFLLNYTGLLKYYNYVFHTLKDAGIDIYTPIYYSSTPIFPDKHYTLPKWVPSKINKLTEVAIKQWTKRAYYKEIAKNQYDVLFITSDLFETGFLKHINNKPFVMTVHDTMIGLNGKNMFLDPNNQRSLRMGYLAHNAERVISISKHTTKDIQSKFMVESDKIHTIYHTEFLPDKVDPIENLPEKFILFVGNRNGRKNFLGWVQAVAPFLQSHSSLHIVTTGKITEYEYFFLKKMGVQKYFTGLDNVSDSQLKFLYQHALCLVYPSLYEGFGLPVLEAMANGCPVITTERSSIPEVAGKAALYINPESEESMLQGLKEIVHNKILRKQLSQKGKVQSKKFSKKIFRDELIRVLKKAVQ